MAPTLVGWKTFCRQFKALGLPNNCSHVHAVMSVQTEDVTVCWPANGLLLSLTGGGARLGMVKVLTHHSTGGELFI